MSDDDDSEGGGRRQTTEPIDIHIGNQIRKARTMRGLSRPDLGKAIGASQYAIEKLETGQNRAYANRLYAIAVELGVPPAFFFEGFKLGTAVPETPSDAAVFSVHNVEFLQQYSKLSVEGQRLVRQMVEQLTASSGVGPAPEVE